MTVSVKLETALEAQLRRHAAATGRTTSEVLRAALVAYLERGEAPARSAYELGASVFGRHRGAPELATNRKRELIELWSAKRSAQR